MGTVGSVGVELKPCAPAMRKADKQILNIMASEMQEILGHLGV